LVRASGKAIGGGFGGGDGLFSGLDRNGSDAPSYDFLMLQPVWFSIRWLIARAANATVM
jgi:hypothetical protein